MIVISSKDNKIFKYVKSLQDKKARNQFFIVEGIKNIEEAAKAGASFEMLVFSEDQYKLLLKSEVISSLKTGQNVVFKPELFSKLADTVTPQGVLAVMDQNVVRPLTKIEPDDVIVVLENLQDPGNMGTVIRTCVAAGVKKLVTIGDCVDLYSPKTVRATMGGLFHIQHRHFESSQPAISFLKENYISTYALAPKGEKSIYDIRRWRGIALFIGNESYGLLPETVINCDEKVNIPMPGNFESLNAAVAASLVIYETVRSKIYSRI
ncbi:MAG TPA: hypothetical protein DDZ89_19620 [Clostridiales bacterium]|nr:hypothetical protein [Clostridiales bacterium]